MLLKSFSSSSTSYSANDFVNPAPAPKQAPPNVLPVVALAFTAVTDTDTGVSSFAPDHTR